jgi:hypothetical protein
MTLKNDDDITISYKRLRPSARSKFSKPGEFRFGLRQVYSDSILCDSTRIGHSRVVQF